MGEEHSATFHWETGTPVACSCYIDEQQSINYAYLNFYNYIFHDCLNRIVRACCGIVMLRAHYRNCDLVTCVSKSSLEWDI